MSGSYTFVLAGIVSLVVVSANPWEDALLHHEGIFKVVLDSSLLHEESSKPLIEVPADEAIAIGEEAAAASHKEERAARTRGDCDTESCTEHARANA